MSTRIINADCRDALREMPDESVHCVVTSPPYWGLRDYKLPPSVWGGKAACAHDFEDATIVDARHLPEEYPSEKQATNSGSQQRGVRPGAFCRRCGAWRGVLGLEPTVELHVAHIVDVFREVRRVLRVDGTVWLNYGDCYASAPPGNKTLGVSDKSTLHGVESQKYRETLSQSVQTKRSTVSGDLKPKDLVLLPARVALALQADGWWLRSDIIWHKPNPMPESVTDRPTSAHEHVFLLAKSARYFYDAEAVREPSEPRTGRPHNRERNVGGRTDGLTIGRGGAGFNADAAHRNLRNVWTIATAPFPSVHFATFPPALVEPCIKAGTSEKGCCAECGAPWVREVESGEAAPDQHIKALPSTIETDNRDVRDKGWSHERGFSPNVVRPKKTTGWSRSCDCNAEIAPCTVLDPFAGAGTTGLVADRLGRDAILIEMNPDYADMARRRIAGDDPLFSEVAAE